MSDAKPDQIDDAIASSETPQLGPRIDAQIALLNQPTRIAILSVPVDITDLEWLALMNAALQIGDQLRAKRPAGRLVLPGGARTT